MPERPPSDRFSLVGGGPLHALACRLGLSTPELGRIGRRIALVVAVGWLPLALLTAIAGTLWGDAVAVPFAVEIETHVRLLLAAPLLLFAELAVHERLPRALRQFLNRDLVRADERGRFEAAIAGALRARDHWAGEAAVALFVLLVSRTLWRDHLSLDAVSWFGRPSAAGTDLEPAGLWLAWVSVPLYQFLVYRWLYRLGAWIVLLARIARLDLRLVPTHPDGAGGLGFLGTASLAFSTLLVSSGVLLSGMIANYIFFEGARLTDYKLEVAGFVLGLLFLILGPLAAFTPTLVRVRRIGLGEYGNLAHRYVRDFDAKWLRGGGGEAADFVGSADIQSLADLANGYGLVRTMRPVPFGRDTALKLAGAILVPILPLTLTLVPLEELVDRLIGVVL